MKIGSLFSGYGGLDLACEAFFDAATIWHADIDPAASRILAHHWPDIPNLGDITAIDWDAVEPVDVLTGGFPCQDVSAAGRRAGIAEGTRSGLWAHMHAAITHLRPRYVVIENVRGLLSARAHRPMEPESNGLGDHDSRPVLRALGAVLGDLADIGYDAQWTTIAAADVGACHRRERVFILATPADADSDAVRVKPVTQSRSSGAAIAGRDRAGSIDLLPPPRSVDGFATMGAPAAARHVAAGNGSLAEVLGVHLLPTPCATDGTKGGPSQRGSSGDLMPPSAVTRLLPPPSVADSAGGHLTRSGARGHELLLPGVARAAARGELLPTPSASDGSGGGQHPDKREGHSRQLIDYALLAGGPEWGQYAAAVARQATLSRPAPAPTEPNTKGNPRLSAAFPEWMMFLPAGWVTDPAIGLTRNEQLKAIGNGVVPPQAFEALRRLWPMQWAVAS